MGNYASIDHELLKKQRAEGNSIIKGTRKKEIYQELLHANQIACTPPLPASEIQTITNSVTKYRR